MADKHAIVHIASSSSEDLSQRSPIPSFAEDDDVDQINERTCVLTFANMLGCILIMAPFAYPVLYVAAGYWMPYFKLNLNTIFFLNGTRYHKFVLQYTLADLQFTDGYLDRIGDEDKRYHLLQENLTVFSDYYDALLPQPLASSLEPILAMTNAGLGISCASTLILFLHFIVVPGLATKNGHRIDPYTYPDREKLRLKITSMMVLASGLLVVVTTILGCVCLALFRTSENFKAMELLHESDNEFQLEGADVYIAAVALGFLSLIKIFGYLYDLWNPEDDILGVVPFKSRNNPAYNQHPSLLRSTVWYTFAKRLLGC